MRRETAKRLVYDKTRERAPQDKEKTYTTDDDEPSVAKVRSDAEDTKTSQNSVANATRDRLQHGHSSAGPSDESPDG